MDSVSSQDSAETWEIHLLIGLIKHVADARPDQKRHQQSDGVLFQISRQGIFLYLRKQDQAAQKEKQLHDKRIKNTKGQVNVEMGEVIERNGMAKDDHDNPHALERVDVMIPAAF